MSILERKRIHDHVLYRSTFESAKDIWQSNYLPAVNQAKIKHGQASCVQTSFGQGQKKLWCAHLFAFRGVPSGCISCIGESPVSLSFRFVPGSADFLCQFVACTCRLKDMRNTMTWLYSKLCGWCCIIHAVYSKCMQNANVTGSQKQSRWWTDPCCFI